MKGAKVRRASVRRMWFSVGDDIACPTKNDPRFWWDEIRPVIVLPATPEDIEGYVEAMANGIKKWERHRYGRVISGSHFYGMQARAALRALLGTRTKGKG